MALPKLSLAFVMAAALALPLAAQTPPALAPAQSEPQFIAQGIYRALLGREADPSVIAEAAMDVQNGRVRQRVNAIVLSSEFRSRIYGLPPERILAQIYQGLLARDPDASAANYQRLISMAKYADVIAGIIATPEFKAKLAPFTPEPAATAAATVTAGVAAAASPAVVCQEQIVESIRTELGGIVFVQFDAAAIDGTTITGAAMDVNGGGRRLTYRCDPAPTYQYDDGRRERQANAGADFASDIVRACQSDVRLKAQQDFGAARLVFQSAGLMAAGTASQFVRGLATERMPSGAAGPSYNYSCDMNGTQVVSSSVRAAR